MNSLDSHRGVPSGLESRNTESLIRQEFDSWGWIIAKRGANVVQSIPIAPQMAVVLVVVSKQTVSGIEPPTRPPTTHMGPG